MVKVANCRNSRITCVVFFSDKGFQLETQSVIRFTICIGNLIIYGIRLRINTTSENCAKIAQPAQAVRRVKFGTIFKDHK